MNYIQKIVPANVPMLQMPKDYDVISYRIEHVETAQNPQHYLELEKVIFKGADNFLIPEKYLDKYIYGPRIEPFIRIHRTIAPHSEVEKYLKSGGNLLTLFKRKDVDSMKEEPCYTSIEAPHPFVLEIGLFGLTDFTVNEKIQKERDNELKRNFERDLAPKLKNTSNKFIMKCLEIDEFFNDIRNYLDDPADFHREQIIKRAAMLDNVFELCRGLDPKLPDGFAAITSSLTKNKIVEILSVIEVLKWQVGIIKEIDEKVLDVCFYTKDILWNSKDSSMLFSNDSAYIFKDVATREENKRLSIHTNDHPDYLSPDTGIDSHFRDLIQANPHKHDYYRDDSYFIDDSYFFGFLEGKSIKNYITGNNQNNLAVEIYNLLVKCFDSSKELTDESKKHILNSFINFIHFFLEGVILKNLERYPVFIRNRFENIDAYPGNMFRLDLISDGKYKDYINYIIETEFEIEDITSEAVSSWERPTFFNIDCPGSLLFDLTYLADYSGLIIYAGELEEKGLSIYEALKKINEFDPNDMIASRFLAEFVSKEINEQVITDLWDKASGKRMYEEGEKKDDPAEARAVEAFKIYRRTLRDLDEMIGLASKSDPTISMFKNNEDLPSLYDITKDYLLNKLLSFTTIPLNKAFARDASEKEMSIWEYIPLQNNAARITRNKFSHGVDIKEEELIQFVSFCNKIIGVTEEVKKNSKKTFPRKQK